MNRLYTHKDKILEKTRGQDSRRARNHDKVEGTVREASDESRGSGKVLGDIFGTVTVGLNRVRHRGIHHAGIAQIGVHV